MALKDWFRSADNSDKWYNQINGDKLELLQMGNNIYKLYLTPLKSSEHYAKTIKTFKSPSGTVSFIKNYMRLH